MKTIIIMIVCMSVLSCKKNKTTTKQNETDETVADSAMTITETTSTENANLEFDFVLKNIDSIKNPNNNIVLPKKYTDADFIEKFTSEEVDLLIGNIVQIIRKEGNNTYFRDIGKNYKKSNINLKLKIPTEPQIYENTFDYKESEILSAIIGGISYDKETAYLFQIFELSNLYVEEKDLDIEKLKNDVKNQDISDLYIIKGVTNYSLKANAYKKNKLKGNFNYAIMVSGEKYASTTKSSKDSKIAVTAIPLSQFLRF